MDCEQAVYFFFSLSRASRSCRAQREISRSPRFAHKALVMQASEMALWAEQMNFMAS